MSTTFTRRLPTNISRRLEGMAWKDSAAPATLFKKYLRLGMVFSWIGATRLATNRHKSQNSFTVDRERQQHVTGHGISRVARCDVQHAAGDNRSHAVDRAAARVHTIDRFKLLHRVEVPDDFSGLRFIGANVTVPRAEKYHTGNGGDWCGLRCAAPSSSNASWLWRRRRP